MNRIKLAALQCAGAFALAGCGSDDGRVVRRLTLTPAPAVRRETLPWQTLARYTRKEYADYLD
ncbi:hypothetical protein [Burkholderia sp. LMG 21824]|uniref:hypothetical protein n=1 Tax=Burkholderia sp. LMG 21824 TaxID=3158172 RepID=UPI003C2BBBED